MKFYCWNKSKFWRQIPWCHCCIFIFISHFFFAKITYSRRIFLIKQFLKICIFLLRMISAGISSRVPANINVCFTTIKCMFNFNITRLLQNSNDFTVDQSLISYSFPDWSHKPDCVGFKPLIIHHQTSVTTPASPSPGEVWRVSPDQRFLIRWTRKSQNAFIPLHCREIWSWCIWCFQRESFIISYKVRF